MIPRPAHLRRLLQLLDQFPGGRPYRSRESHEDDGAIRRTALKYDIPCITTLSGATACAEGIAALRKDGLSVRSLQEMGVAEVAVRD